MSAQSDTIKDLFGRPVRVMVAAWVMKQEGRRFYQSEAYAHMAYQFHGGNQSAVCAELEKFTTYAMLKRTKEGNRVYYQQQTNRLWDPFLRIYEATRPPKGNFESQ